MLVGSNHKMTGFPLPVFTRTGFAGMTAGIDVMSNRCFFLFESRLGKFLRGFKLWRKRM